MRTIRIALAGALISIACGSPESDQPPTPAQPAVAAEPAAEVVREPEPSVPITAETVCGQFVEAGIGNNCRRELPGGANARARMRYDFDLASVPGKGGSVLSFDSAEDYEWTAETYAQAAFIAGSHRYGNRSKLIFVQLNEATPLEVGDRARALVEGL